MRKSLCHLALEYASIEPTDHRVAIYKSILMLPKPFSQDDIHKNARLNGRPLNKSTITGTLILFKKRRIVEVAREVKDGERGRPAVLYRLT